MYVIHKRGDKGYGGRVFYQNFLTLWISICWYTVLNGTFVLKIKESVHIPLKKEFYTDTLEGYEKRGVLFSFFSYFLSIFRELKYTGF